MNNNETDKKTQNLANEILKVCYKDVKKTPPIVIESLIMALAKIHHLFFRDKIDLKAHAEWISGLFFAYCASLEAGEEIKGKENE